MATYRKKLTPFDQVAELLRSGRLNEACAFLSLKFASLGSYRQVDDCKTLQADYGRLLSYYTQGIHDPHRNGMLDSLMDKAWALADQLEYALHPVACEEAEPIPTSLEELHSQPADDSRLYDLFVQIADSPSLSKEERKSLHQAILDEGMPEFVRATLLGAVTLHLLQWFDAELVENLYIYTLDDQPAQLRMRAWVTLVFVAIIHSHRIKHLPRLREQYQLLAESEPNLLFQIQIALLQCREAFTFDKKLHDIVNTEGEEVAPSEQNVKEFLAFISEGIDMSLSTFAHLKELRFFSADRTRHHWFEPFSLEHAAVKPILDEHPESKAWTNMLMQSAAQCETDKYGAFISMHQMNERLMSIISKKLEDSGLNLEDVMPLPQLIVMRNYLHDLFRYCNFHPEAKRMRFQPFSQTLNLSLNPWLREALNDAGQLKKIAEFLFRKERWNEAIEAYQELLKTETTEEAMQRLAYSAMEAADPSNEVDIVECLVRCNQLYPGNKWTEKNLADLLHAQGTLVTEEICLSEALSHHPDDVGLLMRMGRCLTQQGRAAEALSHLYKADLTKEGQLKVQRVLAQALFEMKNHDGAEQYILKVLNRPSPSAEDWLLGGHIALMNEDVNLALDRYMQAEYSQVELILSSQATVSPLQRAGIDYYTRQLALAALTERKRAQDDEQEKI